MIGPTFRLCARETASRLFRNLPWIGIATAVAVLAVPPLGGAGTTAAALTARWLLLPCVLSTFVAIGGICAFWPTLARDQDARSWTARLHRGTFRGGAVAVAAGLAVTALWLWLLGCVFAVLLTWSGRLPPTTWNALELTVHEQPARLTPAQPSLELKLADVPIPVAGVDLRTRLLWDGREGFRTPLVSLSDEHGVRLTPNAVPLDGTPCRLEWPTRSTRTIRLELRSDATAGLALRTESSVAIGAASGSAIWNGGMAALGCLPGALLGGGLALMLSGMLALRLLIVSTMLPVLLGTLLDWSSAAHAIEALAMGRRITPDLLASWSWTSMAAAAVMVGVGWLRLRAQGSGC